jgi:acetylornithine deacetylase/succinyl-diaminopimelate desuccinylase-like protein
MMRTDNEGHPAVKLLSDLIKIDTSNPPGNEEAAVQFIEARLRQEGIKAQVFSPEPRRANILARLKGKKKGSPVILLGHLDVVPAHDEGWVAPPFSGAVRDGFIYGRGAIDMKSQVVCHLLSFIALHREGIVPERDLIFLATADEEASGEMGAEYMLQKVEDLRHASFVLSEGGGIFEEAGLWHGQVSVAEKKVCQFMLRARGTGGHGSMPHGDNANDKIIRAADRIISTRLPLKPTGLVTRYLNGLFQGRKIGGMQFVNLKDALRNRKFLAFLEQDPLLNALLHNTATPTMLKAGQKVNVIPTESTAGFDARILPGETHEGFLARIRRIAGPDVEVLLTNKTDSAVSPHNTPYFRYLAAAVRELKGDMPVLPFLTTGATDLRHFRNLGIPAYGFFPIALPKEEEMRMHGLNERISVENLIEGLTGTEGIVRAIAAYDPPG